MKETVLIFGGDGYIGWPLAVHLGGTSNKRIVLVDNFVTRKLVASVGSDSLTTIRGMSERLTAYRRSTGKENLFFIEADARDPSQVDRIISSCAPDSVVHLAQQRSAPFSMIDQEHMLYTEVNNLSTNLNILFSIARHAPSAHLLKMGTMGEYGTPGIEITEGPVEIVRKGRKYSTMFPRTGQSWYHTLPRYSTPTT